MYTSHAQDAAATLKFAGDVAYQLNEAYQEACRGAEKLEQKNIKLRNENETLEECLEETKQELEQAKADLESVKAEAVSSTRIISQLRTNISGFQKDMDGSGRIIDELRVKVADMHAEANERIEYIDELKADLKKHQESLYMYQNYIAKIIHTDLFNAFVVTEKEKI